MSQENVIVDNSKLHYDKNSGDSGGDLILDISIYDWHSEAVSDVMDEYTIYVESNVLDSVYEFDASDMTAYDSGENWYKYEIKVPADEILSTVGNEAWVIVEYPDDDYSNPFGAPNLVDAPLAAFYRTGIYVAEVPWPTLTVEVPNGGESYYASLETQIAWGSEGSFPSGIDIAYSKDDFVSDLHIIESGWPNDGLYNWQPIPFDISDTVKIRVSSTADPSINDVSDGYFSQHM